MGCCPFWSNPARGSGRGPDGYRGPHDRGSRWVFAAVLVCIADISGAAASDGEVDRSALTARQIMEQVDARDDGDHSVQEMEMVLIDKGGDQRVRRLRVFGRDEGEDEYSIMFFLSPANVEGTGFLTYDYRDPERDDDQWLYLPALNRTKRLASSDRSSSFMGSDFTFADMTKRPLDHYEYTLMKDGDVRGHPIWQIMRVPLTEREKAETGYEKSILFIRKDNFVTVRSVHWLQRGGKLKYLDVKALELVDGIWVPTEIHMTTRIGQKTLHRTVIFIRDVRFNQQLDDDLFSVRQLEKGP